jgi:hypothetical protein
MSFLSPVAVTAHLGVGALLLGDLLPMNSHHDVLRERLS